MKKFETIRIDTPAKAHILCMDDNPDVLAMLEQLLGRAGYRCESCPNGATAMAAVQRSLPDLIIADVDLGGDEEGLALCKQLRSLPHGSEVPIVFLSGTSRTDVLARTREAGGAYFLAKPFDPDVLLKLVGESLWMPHLVGGHLRRATGHARTI